MSETNQALTDISTWKRIAYIIFFGFAYNIAEFAFIGLVIAQIIFKLFKGQTNEQVLSLSTITTNYISDILRFMTFQTDKLPFPFASLPK